MGADFYSKAVIGCEVTGKLHRMVTKPGCEHTNAPDAAFCSTCGKKTRIESEEPIDTFDEARARIGLLTVVCTTDRERWFAGIAVSTGMSPEYPDAARLAIIEDTIPTVRRELERIGLWNADSFGLWAVQYCSY